MNERKVGKLTVDIYKNPHEKHKKFWMYQCLAPSVDEDHIGGQWHKPNTDGSELLPTRVVFYV